MKIIILTLAAIPVIGSPLLAADLQELRDAIDEIESKIDDIDLDQSKDDIRSELDEIKQALEDLEGNPVVYERQHSSSVAFSCFSPTTENAVGNLSRSGGRGCRPVAISVISGISARNA
jgi:hypothetical protein